MARQLRQWQRLTEVRTAALLLVLAMAGYLAGSRPARPPHRPLTASTQSVPATTSAPASAPANQPSRRIDLPTAHAAAVADTTTRLPSNPAPRPGQAAAEPALGWQRVAHWPLRLERSAEAAEPALLWIVPPGGLVLEAENVCLRNIHFAADPHHDPGTRCGPLLELRAQQARLERCSFQALERSESDAPRPAILWRGPTRRGSVLPTGALELVDCVVRTTGPGVQAQLSAAARLSFHNCLVVSPGAAVAWQHPLPAEEPWRIDLVQSTFRGPGSLLQMPLSPESRAVGELLVVSHNSVLAMDRLLLLAGAGPRARMLRSWRWQGVGSLLAAGSALVQGQSRSGALVDLDEYPLEIAGLAHSRLTFAGLELGAAADSVLEDWQAPLLSEETPGIDSLRLWYPARPE